MSCTGVKGRSVSPRMWSRNDGMATDPEIAMMTSHKCSSNCPESSYRCPSRHGIAWAKWCAWLILTLIAATACDPINLLAPGNPAVEATSLSIAPGEVNSLALGQLVSLRASARDDKGIALPYAPVVWTAADPGWCISSASLATPEASQCSRRSDQASQH